MQNKESDYGYLCNTNELYFTLPNDENIRELIFRGYTVVYIIEDIMQAQ
ncbi:MAG: hypothetical protein QG567_2416 [Campylobacterota bacterium]|nr:hypothetical protein [Campylobacterota bacterium]